MILSKEDKISIYKKALFHLEQLPATHAFICNCVGWSMFELGYTKNGGNDWVTEAIFPELFKHKPQTNTHWWFPATAEGKQTRINIIKSIIT